MLKRHLAVLAVTVLVPSLSAAQERPFELEGFVITATPTPRPVQAVSTTVTVLEGDALRAQGLTQVQDALAQVPGVDIVRGGSYGSVTSLFMRGAESDHVLFLVDGVQVNQPGGAFDLSGLTLDNVERIEVVRGPASALYGSDAVAGVVQVVTRSGREGVRGSVGTRFGTYGRQEWSAEASGGSDRGGFALSVSRARTDGILPFNNQWRNTVFSGSAHFAPDARTWSRVSLRVDDRTYHFPTDGAGVPVDHNAYTFGDGAAMGASLGRALSDQISLQAHLTVDNGNSGSDDAPDSPADTLGYYGSSSLDHARRSSLDVWAVARVGGEVLTAGGELEREAQRTWTESLSQFGNSTDRSDEARSNRAAYAHLSGDRSRLSYDVGARLEDNQRFGRLGTWQVGGALRLDRRGDSRVRASVGTAIKEPTFYENFATGFSRGNPDLLPERSRAWELGLEQSLSGGAFRWSATFFRQGLRDLIQYTYLTDGPDDPNFFNVAAANSRGLEVEGSVRAGDLSAGLTWTWLHTEVVDAGYDEGPGATFVAGAPLIRRPNQSVSARLGYILSGAAALGAEARWVGARADRDFSAWPAAPVTLAGYVDVAASAEVLVLEGGGEIPRLHLTLRAENLLDENIQDVFGFPAPGRVFLVGLRAAFGR